MLKKTLNLIKFAITGIIWTYLYAGLSGYITVYFWKFNPLSSQNWSIISQYWDSGNAIATTSDYLFFLTLLVLFIIWLWGLFFLSKQNYLKILLSPVTLYNNYICRHCGNDSPRIILKNLGVVQKQNISQLVEQKLQQEKNQKKPKIDIRSDIKTKIESIKK